MTEEQQTSLLDAKQQARVLAVMEAIANGATIEEACEAGGIAKSTLYAWQRAGKLSEFIAGLQASTVDNLVTLLYQSLPDVIIGRIDDATSETASIRDRCDASRILTRLFGQLLDHVPAPPQGETVEDVERWLQARKDRFPSVVAIQVQQGDVNIVENPKQRQERSYGPILGKVDLAEDSEVKHD